jgi:hypothetical protein
MQEYPGLWLRFANECFTAADALAFVNEFGLLGEGRYDYPDQILNTAELIRQIHASLENGDRTAAADLFSRYANPSLTAHLSETAGKFAISLAPLSLRAALLLQAAETITSHRQWRRCRNDGCREWFRLGQGAHTTRREFCSDRCRVATARRRKEASRA